MRRYLIHRCLQTIIVLLGVTVVVFLILHITGDPASLLLSEDAMEEDLEELRQLMGFNDPLLVQFGRFLPGVFRFDFGESFRQGQPAMGLVFDRMPATIELSLCAFLIAFSIALPAGIISACRRDTVLDHSSMFIALLGQSMPTFWLGLLFIMFVSLRLDLLPTSARLSSEMTKEVTTSFFLLEGIFKLNGKLFWDALQHILLPALTAGLYATARLTRLIRSSMLDVLGEDYVQTAWSKGLAERYVVGRHAFKNASIPVVTLAGIELGHLLSGTVVIEVVFSWPGVGFLSVEALQNDDFPVVQAAVFFLAFIFVFINLVVDLLYGYLDPRIRLAE
ncbi:ABC transporter permease [Nitrospinota bacterium]